MIYKIIPIYRELDVVRKNSIRKVFKRITSQRSVKKEGELGSDPAERTIFIVDPLNLIQVMLAEGIENEWENFFSRDSRSRCGFGPINGKF